MCRRWVPGRLKDMCVWYNKVSRNPPGVGRVQILVGLLLIDSPPQQQKKAEPVDKNI